MVKSHCSRVIKQSDFLDQGVPSKPYVISEPGKYTFGSDIIFSPLVPGSQAITVASNNVYLDFCKHELSQGNSVRKTIGIYVTTGVSNFNVQNGIIRGFSQLGMYYEGGISNMFLGTADTTIKVVQCGYGSKYAFIDDNDMTVNLQGGIVFGHTKLLESRGYYTWLGVIDTARLINVYVEECGPIGFILGTGTNITFEHVYCCRNYENREVGFEDPFGFWAGVMPANSHVVVGLLYASHPSAGDEPSHTIGFSDCHFDLNTVIGGTQFCFGFQVSSYNMEGLTVRKCSFNGNEGSGCSDINGFGTLGTILDGSSSVLFEDCEASNNKSEFSVGGFHHSGINFFTVDVVRGKGLIYRRCRAIGNITKGAIQQYQSTAGIVMFWMDGLLLEDCQSMNNEAISTDLTTNPFPSTQGIFLMGSGYDFAPLTNITIRNCLISGNRVNGENGDVEGIFLAYLGVEEVTIENCTIKSNVGANFNPGIFLRSVDETNKDSIVQDCTIQNQSIGIYSNGFNRSIIQRNTITQAQTGIFVDSGSCNSITENSVLNSTTGYQDTTNPSTNLFASNKAVNTTVPFDVTYAFGPVPYVSGSAMSGFPPLKSSEGENVSMDLCTPVLNKNPKQRVRSALPELPKDFDDRISRKAFGITAVNN